MLQITKEKENVNCAFKWDSFAPLNPLDECADPAFEMNQENQMDNQSQGGSFGDNNNNSFATRDANLPDSK